MCTVFPGDHLLTSPKFAIHYLRTRNSLIKSEELFQLLYGYVRGVLYAFK